MGELVSNNLIGKKHFEKKERKIKERKKKTYPTY